MSAVFMSVTTFIICARPAALRWFSTKSSAAPRAAHTRLSEGTAMPSRDRSSSRTVSVPTSRTAVRTRRRSVVATSIVFFSEYASDYFYGQRIRTQAQQRKYVGFTPIKNRQAPENGTKGRLFDAGLVRQSLMECAIAVILAQIVVRCTLERQRDVNDIPVTKHYRDDLAVFYGIIQDLMDRPTFPGGTESLARLFVAGAAP